MIYITGGLVVFFILVLLYFLFRLWLECCRERTTPREIKGETLSVELREDALRPLRQLNACCKAIGNTGGSWHWTLSAPPLAKQATPSTS